MSQNESAASASRIIAWELNTRAHKSNYTARIQLNTILRMARVSMPAEPRRAKRRFGTVPRREVPEKVTLLLPRDTVSRLDYIADRALLGSRGRAVQSLVDEVLASEDAVRLLISSSLRMGRARTPQEANALLLLALNQAGNLATRLDRFLDVKPFTDKQWNTLVGAITPSASQETKASSKPSAEAPRRGSGMETAH